MTPPPASGLPPCCAVASRPDAPAIDQALREGKRILDVQRMTGLTYYAVQLHRQHVHSAGQSLSNAGNRAAIHGAPENRPVLEEARRLQRRASKLLKAIEKGTAPGTDYKAAAALIGQLNRALELQAKLLGEIKAASTTVNIHQTPDWTAFCDLLIEALADKHPEALATAVALIRDREQRVTH